VLQLHRFDVEHHHGRIGDPSLRPYGNGVALWFEIDDFDDAVKRAEALHAEVVLTPHRNPPAGRADRPIASSGYDHHPHHPQAPHHHRPQAKARERRSPEGEGEGEGRNGHPPWSDDHRLSAWMPLQGVRRCGGRVQAQGS
jgi:hypothetical protein